MRNIITVIVATAIASIAWQHGHAQSCFFSADFEDGSFPAGWWNTGVTSVSTGDPVDAWTVGNAAQANANGSFPVLDQPIGDHFIMANDDAPPCDCTMDEVYLTTPVIDLTGRSNVALGCRVFHEHVLGSGPALIEVVVNAVDVTVLDTLDALVGEWQNIIVDLGAYDGEAQVQLRFHWSDGGNWSSGFALDDVCVFERNAIDLSVDGVHFGNDTTSAFSLGDQSARYTQLPLEQAGPLHVSIGIVNRGTTTVQNIGADVAIALDGTGQGDFTSTSVIELEPGERGLLVVSIGWTPTGTGDVDATVTLTQNGADDNPADNSGTADLRITGPGWDDGYGAMARDEGVVQGSVGSTSGFIATNRLEVINEGSHASGASAVLGADSQLGEKIRMILMDNNFSVVDTSTRHAIVQEDIDLASGGGAIYLPFATTPSLSLGDYFVGCQRLSGTGWVSVATSGNCAVGASALMAGTTFDITWERTVPMVRLHLADYGVGLAEQARPYPDRLSVFPNPMAHSGLVQWTMEYAEQTSIRIMDVTGGTLSVQDLGTLRPGHQRYAVDAASLPNGAYIVQLTTPSVTFSGRILVLH